MRELFSEETIRTGRCDGCGHCKVVSSQTGWSFYGCFCKPYRGKRVSEIKDCPLKGENNEFLERCR